MDDDQVVDDGPVMVDGSVMADGPVMDRPLRAPVDEPVGVAASAVPRRPVIDGRLRGAIPWLGIGSWLLFCGALFVSLLGWPDQTALDRVVSIWSDEAGQESASTEQAGPTPPEQQLPPLEQAPPMAAGTGSPERLEPVQLVPDAGPRLVREPGGPPVPRFKPRIDGVAAKFSSAFYEMGNRLQQQGDFDAAIHMRRQGAKLAPWSVSGAS